MTQTLVAWTESIDTGANGDTIAAVTDQHVNTSGDDVTVPDDFSELGAAWAMGVDLTRARLESPRLRAQHLLELPTFNVVAAAPEPPSDPQLERLWRKPLQLDKSEDLRAFVINDGAAASRTDMAAWLLGDRRPLPEGRVDTIRLTSATTLVADVWNLCALTPAQTIQAGTYEEIGMRCEAAGAVLARTVFVRGRNRPGVIAFDDNDDVEPMEFRRGGLGFGWGSFDHRNLPQAEVLSRSADTAERIWLDIVQTGGAPAS